MALACDCWKIICASWETAHPCIYYELCAKNAAFLSWMRDCWEEERGRMLNCPCDPSPSNFPIPSSQLPNPEGVHLLSVDSLWDDLADSIIARFLEGR